MSGDPPSEMVRLAGKSASRPSTSPWTKRRAGIGIPGGREPNDIGYDSNLRQRMRIASHCRQMSARESCGADGQKKNGTMPGANLQETCRWMVLRIEEFLERTSVLARAQYLSIQNFQSGSSSPNWKPLKSMTGGSRQRCYRCP